MACRKEHYLGRAHKIIKIHPEGNALNAAFKGDFKLLYFFHELFEGAVLISAFDFVEDCFHALRLDLFAVFADEFVALLHAGGEILYAFDALHQLEKRLPRAGARINLQRILIDGVNAFVQADFKLRKGDKILQNILPPGYNPLVGD